METGFAFPLAIDPRGGIQGSGGARHLRESLLLLLGTQRGERLMRPDFGCQLGSLVFAPCNQQTANLARFYIAEAIERWEPRAILDTVTVVPVPDGDWTRAGYPTGSGPPGAGLFVEIRYRAADGAGTETVEFGVPLA